MTNRILILFVLAMISGISLTGCLPSETPSSPDREISSTPPGGGTDGGTDGGGDGGYTGGTGYGSVTDPKSKFTDPVLGVSYRYYTGSDRRIGVWDITIPVKADGKEDLTQKVILSGKLAQYTEFGVGAVVSFTATCGKVGSFGQRICTVEANPKCFINKVDGDTAVDSDGYAAFEAADPTFEFLLADDAITKKAIPSNYCAQNFYTTSPNPITGSEKYISLPNTPKVSDTFVINVLNGMALQVHLQGHSQSISATTGSSTNFSVETHYGFSSDQSDCTGFPEMATPLFNMTTGGIQLTTLTLPPAMFISSKSDLTTSFSFFEPSCSSLNSSDANATSLDCLKGGNFRNLNYGFSMSNVIDGSVLTSNFTCNAYGLRALGIAAVVANKYGGVLIMIPSGNRIATYLGVAADRKIDPQTLVGKSLYGMKHFDIVNPTVRQINGGNYFRAYFNPDSTSLFGYAPSITSSTNSALGGNSKTTKIFPLGAATDHAFWDVYSADQSTNETTDTAIHDKFGTSDVLKTSGLYQIFDDASTTNQQLNTQGFGYMGRLGSHIVGIFSNLDTIGGASNFLNLSGILSATNPLNSTGVPSSIISGPVWDTGGIISSSNLSVITVSPWFAAQATTSDRIRIMEGGSAIVRGIFPIASIVGNQITVTGNLLSSAVNDSAVSYALVDGVLNVAAQTIKVNCAFASRFPFLGSGSNMANISIGNPGSMKMFAVDYRTADCEVHLTSLTSIDSAVTLAANAVGVNYGYPMAATSEVATSVHRFLANNTPYLNLSNVDPLAGIDIVAIGSLVEVIDDGGTGLKNGIYIVTDSKESHSGWVDSWHGHIVLTKNGVSHKVADTGVRPVLQILNTTGAAVDATKGSISNVGSILMWEK